MKHTFEIAINIMGDLKPQTAKVLKTGTDYIIEMPDQHEVMVRFTEANELVQTKGTPLDSNTLHSISEALQKTHY